MDAWMYGFLMVPGPYKKHHGFHRWFIVVLLFICSWGITPLWHVFVWEPMNSSTYEPTNHDPVNPCPGPYQKPIPAPIKNDRGFHRWFVVVLCFGLFLAITLLWNVLLCGDT